MNEPTTQLKSFKIYLPLLAPDQNDEVEIVPLGNNLFQAIFDNWTLAMVVKTDDTWHQLDKGEFPVPEFEVITKLIDEHYSLQPSNNC